MMIEGTFMDRLTSIMSDLTAVSNDAEDIHSLMVRAAERLAEPQREVMLRAIGFQVTRPTVQTEDRYIFPHDTSLTSDDDP